MPPLHQEPRSGEGHPTGWLHQGVPQHGEVQPGRLLRGLDPAHHGEHGHRLLPPDQEQLPVAGRGTEHRGFRGPGRGGCVGGRGAGGGSGPEAQDVINAMQKLTPAYRTVFNLYVFEEMTHKEIADSLGISIGTSKSNLAKAKQNLKKLLKKEHKLP
ncbi:MAG: sigma-70 family RNA polymerase sigma factor [Flavobacteriales bacterium]|nr:sigma-70 family RNA polymerase sigma factor [Flavobacteriales bacterium]